MACLCRCPHLSERSHIRIYFPPRSCHDPFHPHPRQLVLSVTRWCRYTLAVELTSKTSDASSSAPHRGMVTTGEILCPTVGTDGLLLLSDSAVRCVVASTLALGRIESIRVVLIEKQQQQTGSSDTPANGTASSSLAAAATAWSMTITSVDVRSLPNGKTLQFSLPSPPPLCCPLHASLLLPCISGPNATIRYTASSSSSSSSAAAAAAAVAAPAALTATRPLFGLKSYTASLNPLSPIEAAAAP
jgi:hypothetical protein